MKKSCLSCIHFKVCKYHREPYSCSSSSEIVPTEGGPGALGKLYTEYYEMFGDNCIYHETNQEKT